MTVAVLIHAVPATLKQIERAIVTAYPGASGPVLPEAVAIQRARWLHDDMAAIGFEVHLNYQPIRFPGMQPMHVPVYLLAGSPFNASSPAGENEMFHAEGSGLNQSDLLKLSRVCEIGHTLLTHTNWPQTHTSRLRDPQDHHAVIEELLWLGRWRNPGRVQTGVRLVSGSQKDVDFRFDCERLTINLEVKYRPRTWLSKVDGGFDVRALRSVFDGVIGKFPASSPPEGAFNVVALTLLTPVDNLLRHHTSVFLAQHPEISAVVAWSEHDPFGRTPELIARPEDPSRLLELQLKIATEERSRAGAIIHAVRHPKEHRTLTVEESIRLMQELAAREE